MDINKLFNIMESCDMKRSIIIRDFLIKLTDLIKNIDVKNENVITEIMSVMEYNDMKRSIFIRDTIIKLKEKYDTFISIEKKKLLKSISNEYDINFRELTDKYIRNDIDEDELSDTEDNLYIKKKINGKYYYFEDNNESLVYDCDYKEVGVMVQGKIKFNENNK